MCYRYSKDVDELLHHQYNPEEYKTWVEMKQATLFCHGIPGVGKTILTTIIVDDLIHEFRDDRTVGIAYIYFNFKSKDERTMEHLAASLLKQLARSQMSLPKSIQDLHDNHVYRKTRPTLQEIMDTIKCITLMYSRIFIVVDALDKSSDCRRQFLSEIFSLQNSAKINILATSRPISDIQGEFAASQNI
jgi:hypothetical protein